jgi:hypothetical protein
VCSRNLIDNTSFRNIIMMDMVPSIVFKFRVHSSRAVYATGSVYTTALHCIAHHLEFAMDIANMPLRYLYRLTYKSRLTYKYRNIYNVHCSCPVQAWTTAYQYLVALPVTVIQYIPRSQLCIETKQLTNKLSRSLQIKHSSFVL